MYADSDTPRACDTKEIQTGVRSPAASFSRHTRMAKHTRKRTYQYRAWRHIPVVGSNFTERHISPLL